MGTEQLRDAFPDSLQENAPLARYTAARIGGSAEFLLTVHSAAELAGAAEKLWELEIEFRLLGGGSNVLVADHGMSGVVILNQAKEVKFAERHAWAESGVSIGSIARRAVEKGLSGLEWAATVPGRTAVVMASRIIALIILSVPSFRRCLFETNRDSEEDTVDHQCRPLTS